MSGTVCYEPSEANCNCHCMFRLCELIISVWGPSLDSVFSAGENYSGQENAVGQAPSDSSSSAFAVLPTVTTTPATETDHAQRAAEIAHLHSHYQQDPTRARLLDIYKAHITELTEMQVEQMREDASAQRETLQIRAQTQDLMKWHRESVGFFAKEISRDIILGLQGGQQGD